MLYPKPCYNELSYKEVVVYFYLQYNNLFETKILFTFPDLAKFHFSLYIFFLSFFQNQVKRAACYITCCILIRLAFGAYHSAGYCNTVDITLVVFFFFSVTIKV